MYMQDGVGLDSMLVRCNAEAHALDACGIYGSSGRSSQKDHQALLSKRPSRMQSTSESNGIARV